MLLEISHTLNGNAPPWVLDAWIGLQFRASEPHPVTMQTRNPGSSRLIERRGYLADAREILGLLALHSENAARWYIENAPMMLDEGQVFLVEEDKCHPIAQLSPSGSRQMPPEFHNR